MLYPTDANPSNADNVFTQAFDHLNFVRANSGPEVNLSALEMQWIEFRAKRWGQDEKGMLALANDCKEHFEDLRKQVEAKRQAERDRDVANFAAGASANLDFQRRSSFANTNCRNLWNFGAALARLAAEIEETRPKSAVLGMSHTAVAPIGSDAELTAFLDDIRPRITKTVSEAFPAPYPTGATRTNLKK